MIFVIALSESVASERVLWISAQFFVSLGMAMHLFSIS
jgi:hypothetical protein